MDVFKKRRQNILESIDGVAVIVSAPPTIRNNDVEHGYRQSSDLYYLTGFDEPSSVLVLSTVHAEHRAVLFVRSRNPEREVWDGRRAGVDGALKQCGVDACYPIGELKKRLGEYFKGAANLHYELGSHLDEVIFGAINVARGRGRATRPWPASIHHPEALWHEMRLKKDADELTLMRRAAGISAEAHVAAMAVAKPGQFEYEVEAVFHSTFCKHGAARVAYTPIVGSGPNATILHYNANNRKMEDGDLLLIDAGCEFGYYASDITRTFPVNGLFTAEQRAVYDVVLRSQLAAIAATKPGATIDSIHEIARDILIDGMIDIGLLSGTADEARESDSYKRFYMHRTSHWLGLDVHDVGAYNAGSEARPLEPGMVITIEPGLYVQGDDEVAPERFRGIGVRIEDDILITDSGYENLSAAVPKTVEEIEAACRA